MTKNLWSVIVGSGCYIPTKKVPNSYFLNSEFYGSDSKRLEKPNEEIIKKFEKITDIKSRRYVEENLNASDIAYFAAQDALDSSNADKESLDYIIVAHNFGDVNADNRRSDTIPPLSSRVKNKLGIKNPQTIAYDIIFGCPGWLQGVIQANSFLKSGDAKRAMVIGVETLEKVSDPHDIDSMIYAEGAGAGIFESIESSEPVGILSHAFRSDTFEHSNLLHMSRSYNPNYEGKELFLKMDGHALYEYALKFVPGVVKESLDRARLSLKDVKKLFLHQANGKMDGTIAKRLFNLYDEKISEEVMKDIMPMTISWLGNSSVATLPTLYDLFVKGKLEDPNLIEEEKIMPDVFETAVKGSDSPLGHLSSSESSIIQPLLSSKIDQKLERKKISYKLNSGDIAVFASVGAGMNINSVVYKVP